MVLIRDATSEDVSWLCDAARSSYAGLVEGYDDAGAERWINACVASPHMAVVRGEGVAAFAACEAAPWAPGERYCDLVHLFGRATTPMETAKVVQAIDRKRRADGVKKFYVGSVFADLGAIGRWLGGKRLPAGYVIEE